MNLGEEQMNLGRTSTKRYKHKNGTTKHKEPIRNEEYITENQISNLEYKEAKTTNQKRKKKKGPKKMRIV